jgi:hypothetical protein
MTNASKVEEVGGLTTAGHLESSWIRMIYATHINNVGSEFGSRMSQTLPWHPFALMQRIYPVTLGRDSFQARHEVAMEASMAVAGACFIRTGCRFQVLHM